MKNNKINSHYSVVFTTCFKVLNLVLFKPENMQFFLLNVNSGFKYILIK